MLQMKSTKIAAIFWNHFAQYLLEDSPKIKSGLSIYKAFSRLEFDITGNYQTCLLAKWAINSFLPLL